MLTEQEVSRSWRKLFPNGGVTPEALDKAQRLLNELRYESPLRHRLEEELTQLRKIAESRLAQA